MIEQTYPGVEDDINHFYSLLNAFKDKRYIKVDGKLLFVVYNPYDMPEPMRFIEIWRKLAQENGLPGFHFVGMTPSTLTFKIMQDGARQRVMPNLKSSEDIFLSVLNMGFDAVNSFGKRRGEMLYEGKWKNLAKTVLRHIGVPTGNIKYDYARTVRNFSRQRIHGTTYIQLFFPNGTVHHACLLTTEFM